MGAPRNLDHAGSGPAGPGGRAGAPPCALWGVLNVTADSFSDGGRYLDPGRAVARGLEMVAEGADLVDVGGASSRPRGRVYGDGAAPVPPEAERDRALPVVEGLVQKGVPVSIDTVTPTVALAALDAGARVVNCVSPEPAGEILAAVAAHPTAELVLMHNRGRGEVDDTNTAYADVVTDVVRELGGGVDRAVAAGIPRERIWIDPGIGFAKTSAQSAHLLGATATLVATGQRVLVGASRKSFIAAIERARDPAREPGPHQRLGGSLAAAVVAVLGGAHAVRVHDVAATRQAIRVAEAAAGSGDR